MGNSPSKDLRAPPLTRTDTSGSAKSSRSIRSRISVSRDDAIQKSPLVGQPEKEKDKEKEKVPPPTFSTNGSAVISRSSSSTNLPPSMMQVEPKVPILIRRNTNETLNTTASFSGLQGLDSPFVGISNSPNTASNTLANILRTLTNMSIPTYPLSPQLTRNGKDEALEDSDDDDDTKPPLDIPSNTPPDEQILLKQISASQGNNSAQGSTPGTPGGTPGLSIEAPPQIDIEDLIQRLLDAGYSGKRTKNVCLKTSEIQLVCSTAREVLLSQPSLLELSPPVKVVGDVHGQYGDLIRIFTKCGFPPLTNYLFLGDYVDRGKQSLETILLLLCYKIKYPENFFLLRGNHECANVTRVYGFYDECKRRCNIKTWKMFIDTFNTLPIAAIVAGKIFCVHGGLSPVLNSMDEIRNIARPTDVPDFGLLNDLLWSDPADTVNEWEDNERGVLYVFSKVAINKFLLKFGFDLVCRAHMVVEDGYEFFNDRTLVTVFSAPNYCGEFDNWGAVMSVSEELLCLFELLDPLDSVALKLVMKKGRQERKSAQLLKQRWG